MKCIPPFHVAGPSVRLLSLVTFLLAGILPLAAQTFPTIHWRNCLVQQNAWYGRPDATRIADNVLAYQYVSGGWPKNIDMAAVLSDARREQLVAEQSLDSSTIDNSATWTQLRFLARVFHATGTDRFRLSFLRGFDYLIEAQYENGGWPQFYPLREGYYSHITFNDEAMSEVLHLLKEIAERRLAFRFVDERRREQAASAVRKGIECIVRCQIVTRGVVTAWCAQHDEHTFLPAKARTYELPSLSGKESVGVVKFLMSIDTPSPDIIKAVHAAVAWFDRAKLEGTALVEVDDRLAPGGRDRRVISDPAADPLWARFYEIGTNRPFFCGRDGVKRDSLKDISYERRNHYNWLGTWPREVLAEEYPAWLKKHALKSVLAPTE